jgi:hypothetical protein
MIWRYYASNHSLPLVGRPFDELIEAFSGSLQCRQRRVKVLYPHHFESAKKGFPHRGHLKSINRLPAIQAKTTQPNAATNAGVAVPNSQTVACMSRKTSGTNPRAAKRLRFLRLRYSRQGSVSVISVRFCRDAVVYDKAMLRQLSEMACVKHSPSQCKSGKENASIEHQPCPTRGTQPPILENYYVDERRHHSQYQNQREVNGAR